jgi:uncharacterized protein
MAGQNPISNLAAVSLRQLRDLARSLGILRSSAESKTRITEVSNDIIAPLKQQLSGERLSRTGVELDGDGTNLPNSDLVSTPISKETTPAATPIATVESAVDRTLVVGSYENQTVLKVGRYAADSDQDLVSVPAPAEPVVAAAFGTEYAEPATESIELDVLEPQLEDLAPPELETRVVFLPRDPQWAYVFWEITDSDRQLALEAGASQLALRVADVTGLQGGSSHPHTLQEVVVDSHATEWYLPVPLSDRDYRVELGYRKKAGGGWISLASSAVARVPSLLPSEQILDQFVPFSLDSPPTSLPQPASPSPEPTDFADSGLHERLYQSATANWRRLGRGSEAFHEFGLDSDSSPSGAALNASGLGLWASGRQESGRGGVPARARSFWLVADAELIVYGATDPQARLSIGGEEVPLSAEGTFRIQVPFRDGQQLYPIEAWAADGEQKRNITIHFERSTPEENINTAAEAINEWF